MYSRYNLKRRMASLPALSSEVFAEKVLTAQASSSAVAAKASFERTCTACQKSYYSENAFQNHQASQKHRLRAAIQSQNALGEDETASIMSSTVSLGDPIATSIAPITAPEQPAVPVAPEAEAEFSKVVDGIKDSKITDEDPVSRRPTRPHHSAGEQRPDHPISPPNENPSITASSTTTEGVPLDAVPLNRCLFCNYNSPTFKLSVLHMTKYHGMFIPEQSYLVDIEGLISWLYARIHDLHECLYCHKIKYSSEAIQTHMRDLGHCKIAFEAEEDMIEVGQFYDFSSTYSDDEEDPMLVDQSKDDGSPVQDKRRVLKQVIATDNGDVEMAPGDENGEGWETDSSVSSVDTDELGSVAIDKRHMYEKQRLAMHRHHSHDASRSRSHKEHDGYHSHAHVNHHAAFHSDHELHLPTGRTAGHRNLNRYYRQNLRNYPSPSERIEQQQQRLLENGTEDREMANADSPQSRGRQVVSRANGGMGMLGVTDAKKKEVSAVEKRETKRAQRAEKNYQWGVDKRGNSQKHFRDPLLQ